MRSSDNFYVFSKWKEAPVHAFGSQSKASVVPPEDKESYNNIYEELLSAAQDARNSLTNKDDVILKTMNWSKAYGSRGHRPVDLWVSLCGVSSEAFAQMPQVYAIASERGLEVGFAASIGEDDYHDPAVKARNRTIIPLLNAKLPDPSSTIVEALDSTLSNQGGWHFNSKARLVPTDEGYDRFSSLSDLIASLKQSGDLSGGGSISRFFPVNNLHNVNITEAFSLALSNFIPLIQRCRPSVWDATIAESQDELAAVAKNVMFDPSSMINAKKTVITEIARRQGQASFRNALLKAYDGRCAITGTSVPSVLEAAHITPYLGLETNHITNGILLRADIHTLFDLRLIKIEPSSQNVLVSETLNGTIYAAYHGRPIAKTLKHNQRPSPLALAQQFNESESHEQVSAHRRGNELIG